MLQVLTLLIQIATIESDICMQDTPKGRHCFRSCYVPGTDFKFTKLSSPLWFLKSLLLVGFGIFFPLKIRFTGTFSQKWLSLSSLKQKYYPIPPTDSSGAAELLQQQNSCCCNLLSKVCPNFNDIVYATWQHVAILWENLFLFWNTTLCMHSSEIKGSWST